MGALKMEKSYAKTSLRARRGSGAASQISAGAPQHAAAALFLNFHLTRQS